ncbi:hypothetical protein ABK040_016533 [Willaertia magna]
MSLNIDWSVYCGNNMVVNTIAGNGKPSFRGEDTPAVQAIAKNPSFLCVTSSNEIIFSDTKNYMIRKIKEDGTIVTVAGTGNPGTGFGLWMNDGPARSINLGSPVGVSVNDQEEIFFSDINKHVIRKILNDGTMIRIAGDERGLSGNGGDGGLAINASFHNPNGIYFFQKTQELYIADSSNHKIRKILNNGTIVTIAGRGIQGFSGDEGLAIDAALSNPTGVFVYQNEVYIADSGNHRIRKISSDGNITTIAGTGAMGYAGDGGRAIDAVLSQPSDVVVTPNGIFITDSGNHRLRRINSDGFIETVAGTGGTDFDGDGDAKSHSLNNPTGITYNDNSRVILIADTNNNRIRKYEISSRTMVSLIGRDTYNDFDVFKINLNPSAIIEFNGEKYFSDQENNVIAKIRSNNNTVQVIAGLGYAGYNGDGILAVNALISSPKGMYISSLGEIYFVDSGNNRIRKILTNGTIITIVGSGAVGFEGDFGPATLASLKSPTDVFVSSNDELFIADTLNNRIRKVFNNGTIVTIAGTGSYGFSGDNGPATLAKMNLPNSVFVHLDEVYFTDTGNHRIRKILTNGTIVTVVGSSKSGSVDGFVGDALLATPRFLHIVSNGTIYFSEAYKIRKIGLDNRVTTIAGTGTSSNYNDNVPALSAAMSPEGLFVSNDTIYYSDSEHNVIRMISKCFSNCLIPTCFGIFANQSNVCNGHGNCTDFDKCECTDGWEGASCSLYTCEKVDNCNGNGVCIGSNQCLCNERYGSYDCKYLKLSSSEILIGGIKLDDGIEKVTTFSPKVRISAGVRLTSPVLFNFYIPNVLNLTTTNNTCGFIIKTKGSHELTVTVLSAERREFIHGNQTVVINVSELGGDSISNLKINDVYEIIQNNDVFNNENKTSIINQIVSATNKEVITTVDQGDKALQIYETVIKHSNIPISNVLTSQINQISNVLLETKKNGTTISDDKVDSNVSSVLLIIDNILQQTNSSANMSYNISTSKLRQDTESTIQTSLSLLSLSNSISEKRIFGNSLDLLFKRVINNNDNTNLNITNEYQFNIPFEVNNNGNVTFGAVKIGDSQLYKTLEMKLTNVFQLKTFVNGKYFPLKNLKNPIKISFKLEKKISFNSTVNYNCKYFDENLEEWKTDGCKSTGFTTITNENIMNCECDHTTSFLTFIEFTSKSSGTSTAQLILSSIYLSLIILIFILLLLYRKNPIIKSRYLTPYIGLTALFIDNLFSGIISNVIFQQTKTFSSSYDSTADIMSNISIIISAMMTLIAISLYLIESIRYLIIRYFYELMNDNPNEIEKKPILRVLSSKLIYILTSLIIGIFIVIYFVIFVLLRRFNVISGKAFSSVTSITFFILIILFSIAILFVYLIDIYFCKKYKQFSNEFIEMLKEDNLVVKDKKKINYKNNLLNFFIHNDTLLFRSEVIIYFFGLIFFIISYCIGFYLLSTMENNNLQNRLSEIILAFDLIRSISWITLFGGFIVTILTYKKIKSLINNKKISDTNNNEDELMNMLKRKELFSLFKQYAKQEFSIENVYAFIDFEKIKSVKSDNADDDNAVWNELERFKIKYLENNATMELNVSFDVKKEATRYLLERKEKDGFIDVIEKALLINLSDTYSRFIETDEFKLIDSMSEAKEKLKM